MKRFALVIMAGFLGLTLGCSEQGGDMAQTQPAKTGTPAATAAPSAPAAAANQGKVLEAMDASVYTYIKVQSGGSELWLAAPTIAVKSGDTVAWQGGAMMSNFTSKSLGRTFDQVLFTDKVTVVN